MFGSCQKALAEAGIDKDLQHSGPKNPKLTREAALELLTQRIRIGGVPTLTILACEKQYLARCLIARCGNFQAALSIAAADAASESVGPVL